MSRPYPPEFRSRPVALVRAGKPIAIVATELGISAGVLRNWGRQDQIDRGERSGTTTAFVGAGLARRQAEFAHQVGDRPDAARVALTVELGGDPTTAIGVPDFGGQAARCVLSSRRRA